jgi:hypothetical protein
MGRRNRGENICKVIYDTEREQALAIRTEARDRRVKRDKLKKLDPKEAADKLMEILEQH